jgi:oligopeptide/dipeptide ABC transporter ATP-binding protein
MTWALAETSPVGELFRNPLHPYTGGLMGCVPDPTAGHRRFQTIPGQAPKPGEVLQGCKYAPRCENAQSVCRAGPVPAITAGPAHAAYCHFPLSRVEP